MHILVTGGAGFIGSHFVKMILRDIPDAFVVTLDALTYAGRRVNLAEMPAEHRKRHVFKQGNVCDCDQVNALLQEHQIDTIVHLAAESHVDLSLTNRVFNFITTNVTGTHVLLEAALTYSVRQFVYVSTDEVYGSIPGGTLVDETHPLQPRNPYAASKAAADLLCLSYVATHQLPVCITRGSNTYGSHQHPEKFLAKCMCAALTGQPMPIYGTGENRRQWLHVQDHCRGIMRALQQGKPGDIFNLGGADIRSNMEMAKQIFAMRGVDSGLLQLVDDRKGHDWRYAMNCEKAGAEIGWKPEITLESGMRETLDWYDCHRAWIDDATVTQQ
jgi:dTDP-glucose 4,6-dehydratase